MVFFFDVEFVAGDLVVDDVGFHLGGEGARQSVVLSHFFSFRNVLIQQFLTFTHF